MPGDFSKEFDLQTLVNGDLNEDFKKHYKDVLSSLKKGEKGKVTINVVLNRIQDMDTMVGIEYDIKSQKPKRKKSSVAVIKENKGQLSLMTDAPQSKFQNVSMMDRKVNE